MLNFYCVVVEIFYSFFSELFLSFFTNFCWTIYIQYSEFFLPDLLWYFFNRNFAEVYWTFSLNILELFLGVSPFSLNLSLNLSEVFLAISSELLWIPLVTLWGTFLKVFRNLSQFNQNITFSEVSRLFWTYFEFFFVVVELLWIPGDIFRTLFLLYNFSETISEETFLMVFMKTFVIFLNFSEQQPQKKTLKSQKWKFSKYAHMEWKMYIMRLSQPTLYIIFFSLYTNLYGSIYVYAYVNLISSSSTYVCVFFFYHTWSRRDFFFFFAIFP